MLGECHCAEGEGYPCMRGEEGGFVVYSQPLVWYYVSAFFVVEVLDVGEWDIAAFVFVIVFFHR